MSTEVRPEQSENQDASALRSGDSSRKPGTGAQTHLSYLDSVRGIAAVLVLLHHAYGYNILTNIWKYPAICQKIYPLMLYAHYDVDVFIVLSGYCLMIPLAKSDGLVLRGGAADYLKRRAWRILPPYFAALLVSALAVWCVRTVFHSQPTILSGWTLGGIVSHLFLVHNLNIDWIGQINPVLWSVATEWQIYFLLPFFLLPIWRRIGALWTLAIAIALSAGPYIFLHVSALTNACPWYVGLFTAGAVGAALNFSRRPEMSRLKDAISWKWTGVLLAIAALIILKLLSGLKRHEVEDPILGLLIAFALATVTQRALTGANSIVVRMLNHPLFVGLGTFSYSIYLIHPVALELLMIALKHVHVSPLKNFLFLIPCEVVAAVFASYLFYLVCERPFLRLKSKAEREVRLAPAPTTG